MYEVFYDIESSPFGDSVALQMYKDNFYLVAGGKSKTGIHYKKWAYPQRGDQSISEKAVPVAVKLGSRREAIEILNQMINGLKGEQCTK